MYNITEQFLQESGFQYDEREEQYRKDCCKYLFITAKYYSTYECYFWLELHGATASLSHITTQKQLKDLVKALSGEEI